MPSEPVPLLWLCGPSGVGKSAVAWEIVNRLDRSNIRVGYIDTDQIGQCYPSSPDDPGNDHLMAASLRSMWPNFLEAGITCFVVSGCIDSKSLAPVYTTVPGASVTLCRLRADHEELRGRFLGRGRYPDLIDAVIAEAESLDHSDFADLCVDTSGLSVAQAAELVLRQAGDWPTPQR